MDALIGHTGFVGGNLSKQHDFGAHFNSSNILDARSQVFDTVVCAAAPGSMFEANRDPERDAANVDALIAALTQIKASCFVLISSIAVFARFDMRQCETSTEFQTQKAYGANRRRLEKTISEHFENVHILRLPALYGHGLKKNFIFDIANPAPTMLTGERFAKVKDLVPPTWRNDLAEVYQQNTASGMYHIDRDRLAAWEHKQDLENLLHDAHMSALYFVNPQTTFQYYGIDALWSDITRARRAGVETLHLATEPVLAKTVYATLTGQQMPDTGAPLHNEDFRTRHAELWGREGPYIEEVYSVLKRMSALQAVR